MKIKVLLSIIAVALSNPGIAGDVTFADGKARVRLPERFSISHHGNGLIATFGEQGSHRLEITLTGVLSEAGSSNAGYVFVHGRTNGILLRLGQQVLFMDPDRQLDGKTFRTRHWQIGVGGCVLEMTITDPAPASPDLDRAFCPELRAILDGVQCVSP